MATKTRSLAKSVTWRIIAILITFGVGFVMSGNFSFAASLSIIANVINFILYYVHERVWLRIQWGKS